MMNSRIKKILMIIPLIFFIQPLLSRSGHYTVFLVKSRVEKVALVVEVAETRAERERGLMSRYSIPYNNGMLFIFESEKKLSFWMKNTYIPLDIAYLSKNGIINEIQSMMPLDETLTYPSKKPAKYALEVNSGWFKRNGIRPGMKLDFNGCLGK